MTEATPDNNQNINRRELGSLEVTATNPEQGELIVRADEVEGVELVRRLINAHYSDIPRAAEYWLEQLDNVVRQLGRERQTDQWGTDYAVFLLDDPRAKDVVGTPSWAVEVHFVTDKPTPRVGVYFTRGGKRIGWLGSKFAPAEGKKLIDAMQDKVANAMQPQN